jgi:pilus assembly protein CpaB
MRPKSLGLLLLALGCGLVASIGITKVMTRGEEVEAPGGGKGILVAATDVGMGDLLTTAMIKSEEWPKDKTPTGAIADLKEIEGRRTRTRLYVGEPIIESRLFPKGTSQQGASATITKGYRIVPVKVDLVSGGSSLILPGDRVDVMAHFVKDPGRDIKETLTRTILQNVKVFAVNDVLDVDKDGSKSINAKTISLLVTPKQASLVMLATQMGVVNLVMRSPESEETAENAESKPSDLFNEVARLPKEEPEPPRTKELPVPVTPPPVEKPKPRPTWTIRVLKASGVDEVKFERDSSGGATTSGWKMVTSAANPPDAPPAKEPPTGGLPPNVEPEPQGPALSTKSP